MLVHEEDIKQILLSNISMRTWLTDFITACHSGDEVAKKRLVPNARAFFQKNEDMHSSVMRGISRFRLMWRVHFILLNIVNVFCSAPYDGRTTSKWRRAWLVGVCTSYVRRSWCSTERRWEDPDWRRIDERQAEGNSRHIVGKGIFVDEKKFLNDDKWFSNAIQWCTNEPMKI